MTRVLCIREMRNSAYGKIILSYLYTHGCKKKKRLLLTDCTANKIMYRTIANLGIFVINCAFILTFIKWQIVLYPFFMLITVIFWSQVMTSFFDTLAAYECLWRCPFIFAHTKMFIMSHPNYDHTRIRVL